MYTRCTCGAQAHIRQNIQEHNIIFKKIKIILWINKYEPGVIVHNPNSREAETGRLRLELFRKILSKSNTKKKEFYVVIDDT